MLFLVGSRKRFLTIFFETCSAHFQVSWAHYYIKLFFKLWNQFLIVLLLKITNLTIYYLNGIWYISTFLCLYCLHYQPFLVVSHYDSNQRHCLFRISVSTSKPRYTPSAADYSLLCHGSFVMSSSGAALWDHPQTPRVLQAMEQVVPRTEDLKEVWLLRLETQDSTHMALQSASSSNIRSLGSWYPTTHQGVMY